MSESPQERQTPSPEGAFGAPPGAPQWVEPRPQPSGPTPPVPQYQGQPQYQGRPQYQGQPAYPQGYPPAYPPQAAYPGYVPTTTTPFPVSTFVLLIVSVISIIATGIIGIPSAILAVIAWRQNAHDPSTAAKRTTRAWVVYAVNFAVAVPLLIWFYVWALSNQ